MNVEELAEQFFNDAKGMPEEQYRAASKKLTPEVRKRYRILRKKAVFIPGNLVDGSGLEFVSPSGKYRLSVSRYKTETGWNYSQGLVDGVGADAGQAIVQRNYGAFPFAWIEAHANGNDYLVCGEDYQGQTVIELNTGKRVDYLPEEASTGTGFCWAAIHPNPGATMLLVEGCYWACPGEIAIYDFSEPMSPPFLELSRPENCEHFQAWTGPNEAELKRSYEARKSDHKAESELSDDEIRELLRAEQAGTAHGELWETVAGTQKWTRPSFYEAVIALAESFIIWRQRNNLKISKTVLATADRLLAKCTPQERGQLELELGAELGWARENLE